MDSFKKVFLAGVGALSLSKDKAKKIVEELIAEGKVKETEGRRLAKEMLERAEVVKKDVEKHVKTHVDSALSKVNVTTQEQLKKMEKRLHDLEQKLEKHHPTTAAKTTRKKVSKKNTKKTE